MLCTELGLPVTEQSGTIQQDLSVLLGAKHRVAARGTFGPAIAGLSERCGEVFYFENKCAMVPLRHGIHFVRVVDRKQRFTASVLLGNWQNTAEQRELMLTYPLRHVCFESRTTPGTLS